MIKAKNKRWEVWTKADGTEISVGDMDEGHLRNALNLVLRRQREKIEEQFNRMVKRELHDLDFIFERGKDW